VLFWMFLMLRRLSSMNFCGRVVSSRVVGVVGGKLYLVVVGVYCGC